MADEVQLRDYQGNPINPKGGGGTPTTVQASNVSVAAGTGLSSTNAQSALKELNDKIDMSGSSEGVLDIAIGNQDESCIVNDAALSYVGYNTVTGGKRVFDSNDDIVVIGHDDLPESDYVGTRKIYNKYNFNATFNYILNAFSNTTEKEKAVMNIKRMIADGNEIGLHAILGASFFWRNLLYDVTPSGGATFAPSLSEMKTVVGDGKNVFGITINSSSTFTTVKHGGDSSIASVLLSTATSDQWLKAVGYYSVYASPITVTGLNLLDSSVTKTYLGWLEYWYNELIDNTLGYSTYTGTIAERFAEDYTGTYPDAGHLLSGELSGYGHFTKGLFKGCSSCCNYEVLDRIIRVAEAFSRYHFGLAGFTNMAYHGVRYASLYWTGSNGALYNNRDCTVLATGHTKMYLSLQDRSMNLYDIALSHGIKMIKRNYPDDPQRCEGQIGLYKGQRNIRGPYFNDISSYHLNTYLALLGTSASSSGMNDNISYQTLMEVMPEKYSDWAKFAYEKAGQDISGTGSVYMLSYYKQAVDAIRKAQGTGKIAFLGIDTITKTPSIVAAIELVLQYCYRHNIRITTAFEGMTISNKDRVISNAFPNPTFKQSLLEDFGGSSTHADAYIPDGYTKSGDCSISVATSDGNKVLTLSDGSAASQLSTRIYGLPSGHYKFSAMAKSTNASSSIIISKKMNSARTSASATQITSIIASSTYDEVSYEFDIPEPHRNAPNGTFENTVCDGYEDNIAYIQIVINAEVGKETSIYNPRIDKQ